MTIPFRFLCSVLCRCYLSLGEAAADVDRNFVRQRSLQKKNVLPSRSAWRAVAPSTVIPQIGSFVVDVVFFMVIPLQFS